MKLYIAWGLVVAAVSSYFVFSPFKPSDEDKEQAAKQVAGRAYQIGHLEGLIIGEDNPGLLAVNTEELRKLNDEFKSSKDEMLKKGLISPYDLETIYRERHDAGAAEAAKFLKKIEDIKNRYGK